MRRSASSRYLFSVLHGENPVRELGVGNALVRDGCHLLSLGKKAFEFREIFHSLLLFVVNCQKLVSLFLMV